MILPFVSYGALRARLRASDGLLDGSLAHGVGRGLGNCSFAEETPVTTDQGPVAISEVTVGEQVLAWDESIEATGYYTVTAVWSHEDPVVVELTVDGELIETTPEHPFLTADGEWVAAGALAAGDEVVNAAGEAGLIELVVFVDVAAVMYNMTVDTAHTYVVGDGEWVVHNECVVRLYHGADSSDINSIVKKGIDLSYGRLKLDFKPANQRGFYITNIRSQAEEWAQRGARKKRGAPTLLSFDVPQSQFRQFTGKIFSSATAEWADFVIAGRNNTLIHSFDYVEGPMLANPRSVLIGRPTAATGHQIAIFSNNMAEFLQRHLLNP